MIWLTVGACLAVVSAVMGEIVPLAMGIALAVSAAIRVNEEVE